MDSGGPVLWQDFTTRKLVLVGITSSGFACASKTPAIDTRVGAFLDWIMLVTPGKNLNKKSQTYKQIECTSYLSMYNILLSQRKSDVIYLLSFLITGVQYCKAE